MNTIDTAREHLETASDLVGILGASYSAFMTLLTVVKEQQDRGGRLFPAFVIAGVSVAGGRFALAEAPSLPASSRMPTLSARACEVTCSAEETVVSIAALCRVMAGRLDDAALSADRAADRHACQEAARHARALSGRFGGTPKR